MTTILGIKLINRLEASSEFQKIITKYGCAIKTRIGLHNVCNNTCTNFGIVLLEIIDDNILPQLKSSLAKIEHISIKSMSF